MKRINSIGIGAALLAAVGCGGEDNPGPLGSIDSLVILQRPARNDMGDIFQYTSYIPQTPSGKKARLLKLSPPTADGTIETLFPSDELLAGPDGAMFQDVDISGYDISFDATKIVISARTGVTSHYGLYILNLNDGTVDVLPTDPDRHYISPIWIPGDKIMFTTDSAVRELDAGGNEIEPRQHRDEYERGVTLQVGSINADGSNEFLGPRNLSHRTFPTLMNDGRIMVTEWRHLGPENAGQLAILNPDFTNQREAFGREGTGASNSTFKAQQISDGRFVAVASSRDRTIQAGALIDIRLGTVVTDEDGNVTAGEKPSEARATYVALTPDVPTGRDPSADTIGRYYDAFPLNAKDKPDLIVSWADGPVESGVLGAAGLSANFGVYLLNTARGERLPILDDPEMWDVFARPLQTRTAPPVIGESLDPALGNGMLIGALNTYNSSLTTFEPGQIYGIRVMEGFSSEEGFDEMFGTTMFEGQANLGVAPLASDGSWLARIPANVPVHLQAIDRFGMSIQNEPVWFSGRAGEQRVCGGCHESRSEVTNVQPGQLEAFAIGPTEMFSNVPRAQRMFDPGNVAQLTRDTTVGVAWDKALQPIFDAKCVSCHGDPNDPNHVALPAVTVTDPASGTSVQIPFDLRGNVLELQLGDIDLGGWPVSYLTLAGPDMEAIEEGNLMVTVPTGRQLAYMDPQNSRNSPLMTKLNPVQQFPVQTTERAFPGPGHMAEVNGQELTADEFYRIILNIDMGANFYARENNPGLNVY